MCCGAKVEETELSLTVWAYSQEAYYLRDRRCFSKMVCHAHLWEASGKGSSASQTSQLQSEEEGLIREQRPFHAVGQFLDKSQLVSDGCHGSWERERCKTILKRTHTHKERSKRIEVLVRSESLGQRASTTCSQQAPTHFSVQPGGHRVLSA